MKKSSILASPVNNVIVEVNGIFNDKIGMFELEGKYRPENNVKQSGIVRCLPDFIDHESLFMGKIKPTVKEGDKIYFDYTIVSKDGMLENYSKINHFFVPYYLIYCIAKDDGSFTPVGNWCILKPVHGKVSISALLDTPESMKQIDYKGRGLLIAGIEALKGKIVYFPSWANNRVLMEGEEYIIIDKNYIKVYESI